MRAQHVGHGVAVDAGLFERGQELEPQIGERVETGDVLVVADAGVDHQDALADPHDEALADGAHAVFVVHVGRLHPRNRLHHVGRGLGQQRAENPADVHLDDLHDFRIADP
ncbi:hypothetical protein [Burkholderia multivorans]|uniref:hypothetical protein n=1 Tax=Burkholderia multivorans TaxID=87883 RepID=UPI001C221700|nr:hypothetical protein [Burkholderia multivorans]MBU9456173.1 hypothetical protein [Burkholderia multivorans]